MSKKFSRVNTRYIDKVHMPVFEENDESVNKLFSIVKDGDYNSIKQFISENNSTFNIRNNEGETLIHTIIKSNVNVM